MIKCKITSYLNSNNTCDLTVAGVKRIAVTNFNRNHTFTTSGEDCFIDTISLDDDYFYPISFAEGSGYANSTVEQGGTADNKSLIHQVGFTLTSIDCNMISNWQSYLMGRLVFAVETKSGTVFIYGHKRGLRASQFDLNTGTAETDESGITALYEGKQASMPLVVKDWSIIEALYAPRPVDSISFNDDNYNITTTEGTSGEVGFRVYDNNGNDITDLCEITISGNYVSVEGNEFVVGDEVPAGRYQTIATVTYDGKTATATIYVDVEEPAHDYGQDYLTFEALQSGTFTLTIPANIDSTKMTSVAYSTDDGANWVTTTIDNTAQTITTPTINAGDKVLWKGIGKQMSKANTSGNYSSFSSTGNFNASGNIMSLLYGDNFVNQTTFPSGSSFNFAYLFIRGGLISAANLILPVTTLASSCYTYMFSGCAALTTAPELPATTLASICYQSMFSGCAALTTAPELPATTLANSCYNRMFANCTSLTTAPELPATTLAGYCYYEMFDGCTSLTTAPELPATTLVSNCYQRMFYGCTGLTTPPKTLPATTLASTCYQNMFINCTSLTIAPELPATTLASYCYYEMFKGCTSLNRIKMLATDISATNCLSNWVSGVASSGIFTKAADMTTLPTGTSGIPENWTVISER